jgi:outer membrane protein OmpA-like peptidoglycan-associated protein
MRYLSISRAIMVTALSLFALTVAADPPSKEELLKALTPDPTKTNPGKSQGAKKKSGVGFRGIQVLETAPDLKEATPPTVQLQQISFDFNSAELTPEARLTLDNLAAAMSDPALQKFRFKLIGHTDSVGGAAFNLSLSLLRAQSAKLYLIKQHHIDGSRLQVEGKGFSELADSAHPDSAVNRRVQVTNLGEI